MDDTVCTIGAGRQTFISEPNLNPLGIMPIKVNIDRRLCKGCGICIRFCPKNVLGESDAINHYGNLYPAVMEDEGCIACRLCELYCPDFAIVVEVG